MGTRNTLLDFSLTKIHNKTAMYQLEKWIYKKADEIIFTKGGKDYIVKKIGSVLVSHEVNAKNIKVNYINNGID